MTCVRRRIHVSAAADRVLRWRMRAWERTSSVQPLRIVHDLPALELSTAAMGLKFQAPSNGRTSTYHHRQLVFQTVGIPVHLDHHPIGTKRGAVVDRRQDGEPAGIKRSASERKA